jgi:hypothetical protein
VHLGRRVALGRLDRLAEVDQVLVPDESADPGHLRLGSLAVRDVVEEPGARVDLVRVGLGERFDALPAELRGPGQPRVVDLVLVQQAGDERGRQQRACVLDRPPRRARVVLGGLDAGRHAAVGERHRHEPVAGVQRVLGTAEAEFVESAQRAEHVQRLAVRPTAVGFERVAEPAVGVAVGQQRVQHRLDGTAVEQELEPALLQDSGVVPDEGTGFFDHAHDPRSGTTPPS